ncbi:hypothetical protein QN277_006658 [Acacia crassicarpa]|uniref:Uncharacterized protein n=1 Tax=Acacia crassicarpa TaxID=499986 RepID=A0AAE1IUG6_9FABA|nr:hypothetical protein QN277_006658 [Acacia crassicarpa]
MDISCPHSNLSLDFSSHGLPSQCTQIADDSISLQLDSSFRDPTHLIPPVPFHLLEPLAGNHKAGNGNSVVESDEDEDREVEEFCILGHPMCWKRRRDGESSSSSSSSSKWVSLDPNLEVQRVVVRSWGNQNRTRYGS